MNIKNKMYNRLKRYKFMAKLFFSYAYDYKRYLNFNASVPLKREASMLEARIIAHYHVLEKGFSHPIPKKCFSVEIFKCMVDLILEYKEAGYPDTNQITHAQSMVEMYLSMSKINKCLDDELIEKLRMNGFGKGSENNDAYKTISNEEIFRFRSAAFDKFSWSRISVRDFSDDPVDLELVIQSIDLARSSPSVCNRQTCKVHVISSKHDVESHLGYQNGSKGFSDRIDKLLVVTSDLTSFSGVEERNQAYVDGGIFLMNLLYALHFNKIGAVTLNWAYTPQQDRNLRTLRTIDESECVIAMIGLGCPNSKIKVPKSLRKSIDQILVLH